MYPLMFGGYTISQATTGDTDKRYTAYKQGV